MLELGKSDNPKILIVDDETEVLHSLADLLRKDFHVFATADVKEARSLLLEKNLFSVVISDQRMPLMTGAEFLAEASKNAPDTARILLTGFSDIEAVIAAVNQGQIAYYITKPWDAEKLLNIMRPLADKHRLLIENRKLIEQLAQLNQITEDKSSQLVNLKEIHSSLEDENSILKTAHDQLQNSFWHLKKIQEVLPICLDCGKVKTSDASWEDVITFLKKNSLFLSHGYCPECAEKVMAQFKIK